MATAQDARLALGPSVALGDASVTLRVERIPALRPLGDARLDVSAKELRHHLEPRLLATNGNELYRAPQRLSLDALLLERRALSLEGVLLGLEGLGAALVIGLEGLGLKTSPQWPQL